MSFNRRSQELSPLIETRKFVKRTLQITSYFILLALPQWMFINICASSDDHISYTLGCFFGAFLLLTVVHMSNDLKYRFPCNWICILIIYETMTIGFGTFIMQRKLVVVLFLLAVSSILWLCAILVGWFMSSGRYPNPYRLAAVSIIGFVVVVSLVSINTFHFMEHAAEVACIVLVISLLLLTISHILITHHTRDILIMDDALLLAFVFYMDYVIISLADFICFGNLLGNKPYL